MPTTWTSFKNIVVGEGLNPSETISSYIPLCKPQVQNLQIHDKFSMLPKKEISLKPFPNKPWFLHVCSTSLLKTLWEKEKLVVTSNFSFSYSVFYLFGELSAIFIDIEIVVCKLIWFGRVENLSFGKGLNFFFSTFVFLLTSPFGEVKDYF